jgi:predicted ArsR family transcriptional regulator
VALKQHGSATIAQLADALQLTGEAVRQQLLQLQRDGWIEAKIDRSPLDRGRTGRPATTYSLTDAGDHLFPKDYGRLNVALIDAVAEELGTNGLKKVLARISEERFAAVEPGLRNKTLPDQVNALKSWYLENDPYMEVEQVDGDYRLMERNCPFLNTAMRRPALCSISVSTLERILGVHVRREEKFQNGHARCVFRVYTKEPIDREKWTFRLESE